MSDDNTGKVGRPHVDIPTERVIEMRDAGYSWRAIARTLDQAVTMIAGPTVMAKSGLDLCQNSAARNEEPGRARKKSQPIRTIGRAEERDP